MSVTSATAAPAPASREARAALVRSRAFRQLVLIVLAIALATFAYVLATMGLTGKTPANVGAFVGILAVAYLIAHLVTVRFAPGADPTFLPTAAVLAGVGYAFIFRIEQGLKVELHRTLHLAKPQFVWILIGLAAYCLTLALVRDHRRLDAYTYTIGLVGILMLLLPIAPHVAGVGGFAVNGARLWFEIGPLRFQPSEIGKVLIVIFLASYLNSKKELLAIATKRIGPFRLPEPRYLAPLLIAWGISLAILFVENDLGSSLLFFGIFVVMLWVATARWEYLVLGALLFAVGALLAYATVPHVQVRVTIWLHALDPKYIQGQSYQLAQGLFAFGTGGLAGTGMGLGHPVLIPDSWTDFILAAIGEELGLLGVTAVLLLYLVLVGRGLRAALGAADGFSRLLAVGLSTVIALQVFVIVGGVTRLIPLTGVTLPFVSYGGSSVVTNFILLALLVRVSAGAAPRRNARLPATATATAASDAQGGPADG
jgi:cell division protein FtsW (lipid II flippase)